MKTICSADGFEIKSDGKEKMALFKDGKEVKVDYSKTRTTFHPSIEKEMKSLLGFDKNTEKK